MNHCNPLILQTIRENNPQKMRKLFNCLNEIYNSLNRALGITQAKQKFASEKKQSSFMNQLGM